MSNNYKKTLYFALPAEQELGKNMSKNIVLRDTDLDVLGNDSGKKFNIVNIKLTTTDEDGSDLDMSIDEIEILLEEKAETYKEQMARKNPNAVFLTSKQYAQVFEKFEADREERMTAHLNDDQKFMRAKLVELKKNKNIQGSDAVFLTNIYDDLIKNDYIEPDTKLGDRKKSLVDIFGKQQNMVNILVGELEDIKTEFLHKKLGINTEELNAKKMEMFKSIKGIFPDVEKNRQEKEAKELERQEFINSQKRGRGRPKKYKF